MHSSLLLVCLLYAVPLLALDPAWFERMNPYMEKFPGDDLLKTPHEVMFGTPAIHGTQLAVHPVDPSHLKDKIAQASTGRQIGSLFQPVAYVKAPRTGYEPPSVRRGPQEDHRGAPQQPQQGPQQHRVSMPRLRHSLQPQ